MNKPNRLSCLLLITGVLFSTTSFVARAEDEAKPDKAEKAEKPEKADKPDPGPAPTAEETKAVEELTKRGVFAGQIASGINWRYVNFRGADKPDAAVYAQLKAIPNIVDLDLSGAQFTPADLANVSGLANLRKLNLSRSNVTDDALAAIEKLEKIESLNLFSTGITDAGLTHLAGLKNLRRLYLFEAKVTDAGVDTLQKAIPELKIDRGWDKTPPPAATPAAPAPEPAK